MNSRAVLTCIMIVGIQQDACSVAQRHVKVATPASLGLMDLIEKIRPSVVRVMSGQVAGTGFFVNDDGVVVTANHVVAKPGTSEVYPDIRVQIRIPTMRQSSVILTTFSTSRASVIAEDLEHDIAVLRLEQNPFNPSSFPTPILMDGKPLHIPVSTVQIDETLFKDGEPVFISGYPLGSPILITNSGIVASSDPISSKAIGDFPQPVNDLYWVDIQANHGNSGGPVFSSLNGSVVGMESSGRS